MAKHSRVGTLRAELKSAGGDLSGRHIRSRWSLPIFASVVSFAFVLVTVVSPGGASPAQAATAPAPRIVLQAQSLDVAGEYSNAAARDSFSVTEPEPEPVVVISEAPAVGTPDPGTAQAIAYSMLQSMGMGDDQYSCLVALWNRESGWNVYAANASGAYGIPQALPGSKMASAGADWATNPATQISWGLSYITGRYGNPCGAWATSESQGWY